METFTENEQKSRQKYSKKRLLCNKMVIIIIITAFSLSAHDLTCESKLLCK